MLGYMYNFTLPEYVCVKLLKYFDVTDCKVSFMEAKSGVSFKEN